MARMAPNGQIDPDVQIALGVLLNTSEVGRFNQSDIEQLDTNGHFLGVLEGPGLLPSCPDRSTR